MKQNTILTIGLVLSILTLFIIVFKEEIKGFLIGSEDKTTDSQISEDEIQEILDQTSTNGIVERDINQDDLDQYTGAGYNSDGSLFTSGSYIDLRANESLTQGQENLEVLYMQNQINNVLESQYSAVEPLVLDGYFGPKTEQALVASFGVDNITVRDINDSINVLMS
jgi:hypothetical protein